MSDALKQMGEKFRGKREEMNLTLKEVENATSIRMVYLQAIEEGRVDQFLSNVYAMGFIRQYGNFLGMDAEKQFPQAMQMAPEKQEFAYGIGTLEMRGNPHGGIRWVPNLIFAAGGLLVLLCAWYFAKFVGAF